MQVAAFDEPSGRARIDEPRVATQQAQPRQRREHLEAHLARRRDRGRAWPFLHLGDERLAELLVQRPLLLGQRTLRTISVRAGSSGATSALVRRSTNGRSSAASACLRAVVAELLDRHGVARAKLLPAPEQPRRHDAHRLHSSPTWFSTGVPVSPSATPASQPAQRLRPLGAGVLDRLRLVDDQRRRSSSPPAPRRPGWRRRSWSRARHRAQAAQQRRLAPCPRYSCTVSPGAKRAASAIQLAPPTSAPRPAPVRAPPGEPATPAPARSCPAPSRRRGSPPRPSTRAAPASRRRPADRDAAPCRAAVGSTGVCARAFAHAAPQRPERLAGLDLRLVFDQAEQRVGGDGGHLDGGGRSNSAASACASAARNVSSMRANPRAPTARNAAPPGSPRTAPTAARRRRRSARLPSTSNQSRRSATFMRMSPRPTLPSDSRPAPRPTRPGRRRRAPSTSRRRAAPDHRARPASTTVQLARLGVWRRHSRRLSVGGAAQPQRLDQRDRRLPLARASRRTP